MSSLPGKTWIMTLREVCFSPFAIVALSCVLGYAIYSRSRPEYPTYDIEDFENPAEVKVKPPLRNLRLTEKMLARYSSRRKDGSYLIALQGTIYDVSSAPADFGPGGVHELLTGTELVPYLMRTAAVDFLDPAFYVKEWRIVLEDHFPVAGHVLQAKDNSVQQYWESAQGSRTDSSDNESVRTANDGTESGADGDRDRDRDGDGSSTGSAVFADLDETATEDRTVIFEHDGDTTILPQKDLADA
ncbi:protein vem-1 [Scaptodrosophila lebanonensis]|uniref:Protein vem-1 n=1 Tax=Drosophila lebanonensis TaxID=7225 RepID=A0A6J2U8P7_DROLE|nr:protein vem-1 [Scaptodrosophila lebanonensis]